MHRHTFILAALATLTLTLSAGPGRSADAAKAASKSPKVTPELLAQGKKVYETSCLVCHGEKGDGDGPAGKALNPKPRDFGKDPFKQGVKPDEVFKSVTEGVKDTVMVGFVQLNDDDRWAVTHYVLTMVPKPAKADGKAAKKGAKAAATPDTAPSAPPAAK